MDNKKLSKKEEQSFLMYLENMSPTKRQETLSFMGYLLNKDETEEEATTELLNDPNFVQGIKNGLDEIGRGETSQIEF